MSASRRAFLGGLLLLAGCAPTTRPSPAPPTGTPQTTTTPPDTGPLRALERRYDARLGVYALATGSGVELAHRADERFAFCSTFKGLAAAAVLDRHPMAHLSTVVRYTRADLMASSFITKDHVDGGMTLRALCDAAVRHSDGTAGNLLLREIGGPAGLTAFARGLGDEVTRMDRVEPHLTSATPGDPRDTSSPRALGTAYRRVLLGDALPADGRAFLRDLMERNTTGNARIRAGVPAGWTVADKTGTGGYATANDIGVVWPPGSEPVVIAIMSSKASRRAERDDTLIAEAAAHVITSLA